MLPNEQINPLFRATVHATEEASRITVRPVSKGTRGADLIHDVRSIPPFVVWSDRRPDEEDLIPAHNQRALIP
jgi:hypothetical protein